MTHITVRLSGGAADIVGAEVLEYGVVPPATVGAVLELIYVKYGRLAESPALLRLSVNGEAAGLDTPLSEGDEIAIALPG